VGAADNTSHQKSRLRSSGGVCSSGGDLDKALLLFSLLVELGLCSSWAGIPGVYPSYQVMDGLDRHSPNQPRSVACMVH
jgi:hypothetical protein